MNGAHTIERTQDEVRILVVAGAAAVGTGHIFALEAAGYRAAAVGSVEEGHRALSETRFAAVVLDIGLAGATELLSLSGGGPDAPALVVLAGDDDPYWLMTLNPREVLAKPLTAAELIRAVRGRLDPEGAPALTIAGRDPVVSVGPYPQGRTRHVLVVDDDPVIGRILTETIDSAGFKVDYIGDVPTCLQMIDALGRNEPPALLLADVFMPDADVFDLMRGLALRQSRTPLLLMSGYGSDYMKIATTFAQAWGLSVVDTLTKPVDSLRLRLHLDNLARAAAPARSGKPVVLVVDDEPLVREIPVMALSAAGFEVLEAADGRQALDRIRACEHVDLLFTDIDMPNMNGIELALVAEKLRPRMRIIFTSGKIAHPPMAHALFVEKPYRIGALVKAVREAVAN